MESLERSKENLVRPESMKRGPWFANMALILSLLTAGQAMQTLSAEETSPPKKKGSDCVQVCNADGSSAQIGNVCFIPGPDAGELYFEESTMKRLEAIKRGEPTLPELLLPASPNRPWCKIDLTNDQITQIRKTYGYVEEATATEPKKESPELPWIPSQQGQDEIGRRFKEMQGK